MRSSNLAKEIEQLLAALSAELELSAAGNMHDLHIDCEKFFCRVLNDAYGYNLRNINDESPNMPGFDLIDENESLLVQVTSDANRSKIAESLSKVPSEYSGFTIKFMFITPQKPKRDKTPFNNPNNLSFTPGADEIDLGDLMRKIRNLDSEKLENLHRYIKKELELPTPPNNIDSLLAKIVKAYSEKPDPLTTDTEKYHRVKFAIDNKIIQNSLQESRNSIQLVAPYVHAKLDAIYNQWAAEGKDVAPKILLSFADSYAQLKSEIANPNKLYNEIIREQMRLVQLSPNCPAVDDGDLRFCISVVMVDAFMRCLVFEGPNVRELEVNDDAPSQ